MTILFPGSLDRTIEGQLDLHVAILDDFGSTGHVVVVEFWPRTRKKKSSKGMPTFWTCICRERAKRATLPEEGEPPRVSYCNAPMRMGQVHDCLIWMEVLVSI